MSRKDAPATSPMWPQNKAPDELLLHRARRKARKEPAPADTTKSKDEHEED